MVIIKKSQLDFLEIEKETPYNLPDAVYQQRVELLQQRMQEKGMDFVVIYGDREHFANIEYFTRYDCRFEEGLFILSKDGKKTIVVGNEGEAYSYEIPYPVERIRYRNFSLQGQPRDNSPTLQQVYAQAGITAGSKVGLVGVKYYEEDEAYFDIPAYMLAILQEAAGKGNVVNFTREITGLPDGLRMTIRTPEEVAFIEYQATKAANVIRRLYKAAKPGMSEMELATYAKADLSPTQMYSLVKVTPESVARGLRSPRDDQYITLGGLFGLCYSLRGSLCSKVGIAAYDEATIAPELKGKLESFFMVHWEAVARWLETMHVGVTGGELYNSAMKYVGAPEFGVTLNPGHYTGMDEWTNANTYMGSTLPVLSGSALQTDIIASSEDPVMCSICEDTIIVADAELQGKVKQAFPEVYARIAQRRRQMREVANIQVSDDVMPMSPLTGIMFPYSLDARYIFALQ